MGNGESRDDAAARAGRNMDRARRAEEELSQMRQAKEREEEKARQASWRELPPEYKIWNDQALASLKQALSSEIQESKVGDTIIRILLIGDTGSGKSSLINSINAALVGKYTEAAIATARDHTTKKYVEHPLATKDETFLPFDICDFRGFGSREAGVSTEAVIAALQGCVQDGDEVGPSTLLRDFNRSSSDAEMLTYIGVVINATLIDTLGTSDEPYRGTFDQIKAAISYGVDNDMPTIVFLTMCDMLDADVAKDVGRIYYSRKVHKAVLTAQTKLGLEEHQIIPVKNITKEVFIDAKTAFQFLFPITYLVGEVAGKVRLRRLKRRRRQQRMQ